MRELYTETDVAQISSYDFFSGSKETFSKKIQTNSVLRYGKFDEKVPLITVVIPTYKRLSTLKWALQSALDQRGFDDYEILVVDNEGADLQIITETEQFIKQINSRKVIYYRHEKSIIFRMEHAMNLARTKWICFLHDDDILASDALFILSKIVEKNPDITWLACETQSFTSEDEDQIINTAAEKHIITNYKILHYPYQYSSTGYVPSWLGTLINRENYVNMGGMPDIWLGCGDFMMIGKYAYRYGVYSCKVGFPLYYSRRWEGQLSSAGNNEWFNNYIEEFLYYRFLAEKVHPVTQMYWKYLGWQLIRDKINDKNNGFYHLSIDENRLRELVHVPKWWSKRGMIYKCSLYILYAYRKILSNKALSDFEF